MPNQLFKNQIIQQNSQVSRVRTNREYLISQDIAHDVNTYEYFGVFRAYTNDFQQREYSKDSNGNLIEKNGQIGTPAVRSIFNRAAALPIGTDGMTTYESSQLRSQASGWRISNNVPLLDSQETRKRIRENSACTIRDLVEQSSKGYLGRAIYSYADFMFCKHLGKFPNNYLITLRRFPIPPGDCISAIGIGETLTKEGKNNGVQQIGCMVNWLGTPGNDMSNILKYSFKMPYEVAKAQWEQGSNADSQTNMFNSIAAGFDKTYREQYTAGYGGAAFNNFAGKFFSVPGIGTLSTGPYESTFIDQNNLKIYGNIDKVKDIYRRSEEGLTFDQNITLTFDYELRAYNGINARQAMLDLLSNILNVTFTTGGWWGGGYRGAGMHQNSIFNNMEIFKVKGGFTEFMDAFQKDYHTVTKSISNEIKAQGGWINTIKNLLNSLGGMLLGGMLNTLGRPARAQVNSLLSEQPTGMWHLMIGNPHHPILSMGNMVLLNTTIQHYGPLGIDDFPIGLKVTCELTRGKGKDLNEIEKMYMHGNDKISYSMGSKVLDMYKNASGYKSDSNSQTTTNAEPSITVYPAKAEGKNISASKEGVENESPATPIDADYMESLGISVAKKETDEQSFNKLNETLMKWFGEEDQYSIYFAAAEQSWGAQKPKKTTTNVSN